MCRVRCKRAQRVCLLCVPPCQCMPPCQCVYSLWYPPPLPLVWWSGAFAAPSMRTDKSPNESPEFTAAPMAEFLVVDYLVIGGGVAGVSCVEELFRVGNGASIQLLSASSVLKGVRFKASRTQKPHARATVLPSLLHRQLPPFSCHCGSPVVVHVPANTAVVCIGVRRWRIDCLPRLAHATPRSRTS